MSIDRDDKSGPGQLSSASRGLAVLVLVAMLALGLSACNPGKSCKHEVPTTSWMFVSTGKGTTYQPVFSTTCLD
jgi:hypothetical protein